MNIFVVLGSYFPNYSAVGICAKNIVDELVSKGHDVWVLCNKTSKADVSLDIAGAKVRYYSTKEIERRLEVSGFKRQVVRAYYYVKMLFSPLSIKRDLVKAITDSLFKLVSDELGGNNPDLVLGMVFPIESIIGALEWKTGGQSNSRLIPVIFDNFVENPGLHRLAINRLLKRKRHIRLLSGIFEKCDQIVVMHNQEKFFRTTGLYMNHKTLFVEHPLLVPPRIEDDSRVDSESVMLLYSGALLQNYVISDHLCQLVKYLIISNNRIKAEFCVMGNDTMNVQKLAELFPGKVNNNGRVPMSQALEKMGMADVFLCVAEMKGQQMSSKIFTYMSFGKPIILIYYNDNDINKEVLQRYPLLFAIRADEISDGVLEVAHFIETHAKLRLSFDEVASLYKEALPETICDYILEPL